MDRKNSTRGTWTSCWLKSQTVVIAKLLVFFFLLAGLNVSVRSRSFHVFHSQPSQRYFSDKWKSQLTSSLQCGGIIARRGVLFTSALLASLAKLFLARRRRVLRFSLNPLNKRSSRVSRLISHTQKSAAAAAAKQPEKDIKSKHSSVPVQAANKVQQQQYGENFFNCGCSPCCRLLRSISALCWQFVLVSPSRLTTFLPFFSLALAYRRFELHNLLRKLSSRRPGRAETDNQRTRHGWWVYHKEAQHHRPGLR